MLFLLKKLFVGAIVTLAWTQSPDPVAYNSINCQGSGKVFTYNSSAPITSYKIYNVPNGTYTCYVTATNANGQTSVPSTSVIVTVNK